MFNGSVHPTKSRNIVHIGNNAKGSGGIASVIRSHVQRSFRDREVFAVCSYDQDQPGFWSKNRPYAGAIISVITSSRSSIFHVHLSQGGSLVREGSLILLASLLRTPLVVTLHGSSLSTPSKFVQSVVKQLLRFPQIVHGFSTIYQKLYAVSANSWANIPNDVNVPPDSQIVPAFKRPNIISFAGEVGTRKGVDVLLEAWSLINTTSWRLMVAGRTSASFEIPDVSPAGGNVTFVGEISHGKTLDLLGTSRILVQPSRAEAFPMTVCEALAHGCAVIGTNVGGMGELLENSGQSVIDLDAAQLASRLQMFMDDELALGSTVDKGRTYALENLSSAAVYEQWNNLYLSL